MDKNFANNALKEFKIETPAWAYGDSGTRFKVFKQEESAKNIYEKIDAAAKVNDLTGGACPTLAVHVDLDETFYSADGKQLELPLTVNPIPGHYADRTIEPANSHFKLWESLVREFDSK